MYMCEQRQKLPDPCRYLTISTFSFGAMVCAAAESESLNLGLLGSA